MTIDKNNNNDDETTQDVKHDDSSTSVDTSIELNPPDPIEGDTNTPRDSLSYCSLRIYDDDEAGPSIVIPDVHILQVRHINDDDYEDPAVGPSNSNDRLGRSNLGYHDSIEMLPVLMDLEERCKYRYSVNADTSDEDQDLGPVLPHRTCSCTCHTAGIDDLPSYEKVMMSIQRSDLVLHDDINCTGEACNYEHPLHRTHNKHKLHTGKYSNRNSPYGGSPCATPGGTRKLVSQVDRILNTSGKSSPVLGKEPPNYRSLIFSIIQDEPPKYEEVTGKKLADELIPSAVSRSTTRSPRSTLRQRIFGVGTFLIVIIITIVLLYLSAEVLDATAYPQNNSKKQQQQQEIAMKRSNATFH